METRKTKKERVDLIFRDESNFAVKFSELPLSSALFFGQYGSAGGTSSIIRARERGGQLSAGIRSLIAERNNLRKMVKEAWEAGGDAATKNCPGCGYQDPKDWAQSRFPAAIEKPWEITP